jgi:uncharacterized membrane protein
MSDRPPVTLAPSRALEATTHEAGLSPGARRIVWGALAALIAGYALPSHYSSSNPDAKGLGAGLSIGPVFLIGAVLLWRWTRPLIAVPIIAVVAAGLVQYWPSIEQNYQWADLAEQCGAYALVAVSFGRTLFGGRVPLCTQLARKIHDELSAAEIAYTRRATVAWALFYVLLATAIGILFFAASEHAWSLFVNFATFGLIAVACIADAAVRHFVLPRRPGGGILTMLRQALIG